MSDFDDLIRGKLDHLRLDAEPQWDDLRQRLDEEAFDAQLRAAMPDGALTSAAFADGAPASQWEALAEQLDVQADLEADVFDRLIARRVAHVEVHDDPAESWRQLSLRVDTLWPLRRVLVR